MATRSSIAVKLKDGSYKQIYCHYDGHMGGVGKTLITFYNEYSRALDLVNLGSLSTLQPRLKPANKHRHSFKCPENGTTLAYHRDRGLKLEVDVFKNDVEFLDKRIICDYNYVFVNGNWKIINRCGEFKAFNSIYIPR